MNRRSLIIQNALPILAQAIARRLNVTVRIGGSTAHVDGKGIQLPMLPFGDGSAEQNELETLAFGYLEQKACRIRYGEEVATDGGLHHALYEVIDGVRTEQRLGSEYPGFADTLRDLMQMLVSDGSLAPPAASDSIVEKLMKYLLYRLRSQYLGQLALVDYSSAAEARFREAVPPGIATRVSSVIGRVGNTACSQDSVDLASELIRFFKDERDRCAQPPAGPSAITGDQHSDTVKDERDRSTQLPAEQSANTAEQQLHTLIDELLSDDRASDATDVGKAVADKLGEAAQAARNRSGCSSAGSAQATTPIRPVANGRALLHEVHAETTALRTRLRSVVEASRRNRRTYGRQGQRFDGRRAVKALLGDPRVYQRKVKGAAVDTAAEWILDRSTSMRSRMRSASKTTLAGAAAMEEIHGMNVGAAVFPGCQADVDVLTAFQERVTQTASRYGGVEADGGTPLLPALYWAADQLLQQPQPRKLLIVVTDGEPIEPASCKEVIRRCWLGGIEVIGIGIQVPTIAELFPVSTCIEDVPELPAAMFGLLQSTLQH